MSETSQQQHGAAPAGPRPRKDWELFWRIVAVLMVLIIGWVVWVLYQITPRSVVTPLAYQSQGNRSGVQPSDASAAPAKPAAPPAPEAAAAALLMDQAQAGLRAGAHQPAADVQAAALEPRTEPVQGEKLKLSTEMITPVAERAATPKQQEAKPDGAPGVPAASAGKARP